MMAKFLRPRHGISLPWICLLTYCALLTGRAHGQRSPEDATTCCECIKTPGYSWYDDPDLSGPFCSESPFHDRTSVREHVIPSLPHQVLITKNEPINPARRRLISPQAAQVSVALGARLDFDFQASSPSRRLQIMVKGPRTAPHFRLEVADTSSCEDGFRLQPRGGGAGGRRRGERRRTRERREPRRNDGRAAGGRSGSRRNRNGRKRSALRRQNFECDSSAPNQIRNFRLVIDMNRCLNSSISIRVRVSGSRPSKMMKVEVKSECSCPCQNSLGSGEQNTEDPSNQHSAGHDGDQCLNERSTCVLSDSMAVADIEGCADMNEACKANQSSPTCSGHGVCLCGMCLCDNLPHSESLKFSGQFCECDDTSCQYHNRALCGGVQRGVCSCGSCVCHEGYTGEACEIDTSTDNCIDPVQPEGVLCNGHGICVSGQCLCNEEYSGPHCSDCPTCPNSCYRFRPCVECFLFGSQDPARSQTCHAICGNVQHRYVEELDSDPTNQICQYRSPDDQCFYKFSIHYQPDNTVTVNTDADLECAPDQE